MVLKVFGAWLLILLAVPPVMAQNPKPPAAPAEALVTVSVGDTAAPPDWELSVPVSVTVADGAHVGRLSMRLEYPAKALRYVSVRGTETLKKAGLDVTAPAAGKGEVDASAPAGTKKEETGELLLEFRPAAGASGKTLPSGRVAIVVFKVLVDAEAKNWPMTVENVRAWRAGTPAAEVKAAAAPPAKFTVSPAGLPIFGCFFYMH